MVQDVKVEGLEHWALDLSIFMAQDMRLKDMKILTTLTPKAQDMRLNTKTPQVFCLKGLGHENLGT